MLKPQNVTVEKIKHAIDQLHLKICEVEKEIAKLQGNPDPLLAKNPEILVSLENYVRALERYTDNYFERKKRLDDLKAEIENSKLHQRAADVLNNLYDAGVISKLRG